MTLRQQVMLSSLLIPPRSAPTGITFARTNGINLRFSEPATLGGILTPPPSSGVYVILVVDGSWGPRSFRPIYFGKTNDFQSRVNPSAHEHYYGWCRVAGGAARVYASFCYLQGCPDSVLLAVEKGLIDRYNPECNIKGKNLGVFARAALTANRHVVPSGALSLRERRHAAMTSAWDRARALK